MRRVAFLGCGNMAKALLGGWHQKGAEIEAYTYDLISSKSSELASEVHGQVCLNLNELTQVDYLVLACKPQHFLTLAASVREYLAQVKMETPPLALSIMAGITTGKIREELGLERVVRVMPNTPALLGAGVSVIYSLPQVSEGDQKFIAELFSLVGKVFWAPKEQLINMVTPFSGAGPAYIFEIARMMSEKLSDLGMDESEADQLVRHTFLGSALMMVKRDEQLSLLRDQVTSPHGVAHRALEVFAEKELKNICDYALDQAYIRANELGQ